MNRLQKGLILVVVAGCLAVAFSFLRDTRKSVLERRQVAVERDALERRKSEAADLRLCEVAINQTRADFRNLIADLTKIAPPPEDEAEAARRVESQRLIAERYAAVDCRIFIADQLAAAEHVK